jgi:hypothetical protein
MSSNRRFQLGFKLTLSTVAFLCLTVVAGFALRMITGDSIGRSPASVESGAVFEHRGTLSASELGMLGSTPLKRGRRVVFHAETFSRQALTPPNEVALNLFTDTTLVAQMQNASAYTVNEGLLVGTIVGDDESSVRILVQNGIVDGTIKYRGSEFRIIDGANGQAIVTEARTP